MPEIKYNTEDLEFLKDLILLVQFLLASAAIYFKSESYLLFFTMFILIFWIIRTIIKKKIRKQYHAKSA